MSTAPVQSPIALEIREAEYDDEARPLEFVGHWDKVGGAAELINTGTSAMITLPNRNRKPYIIGGPLGDQKFIFEQIHWHWVSFFFRKAKRNCST
jgi:carbonic anhydrase